MRSVGSAADTVAAGTDVKRKRKRNSAGAAAKAQPTEDDRTGATEDDTEFETEIDQLMSDFIDPHIVIPETKIASSESESTDRETSESYVSGAESDSDERPVRTAPHGTAHCPALHRAVLTRYGCVVVRRVTVKRGFI